MYITLVIYTDVVSLLGIARSCLVRSIHYFIWVNRSASFLSSNFSFNCNCALDLAITLVIIYSSITSHDDFEVCSKNKL